MHLTLTADERSDSPSWSHRTKSYPSHDRHFHYAGNAPLASYEQGLEGAAVIEDVVTFSWHSGARELRYTMGPSGTEALMAFWLVNIALPSYPVLERIYQFLHAAAIVFDGSAVLFAAPSFVGKSTRPRRLITY